VAERYSSRLCAEKGHEGWSYTVGDPHVKCRCGDVVYPLGPAEPAQSRSDRKLEMVAMTRAASMRREDLISMDDLWDDLQDGSPDDEPTGEPS
jgi:hypothetical protein